MRQLKQQQSRKHKVVGGRWAVGGCAVRERGPAKSESETKNSAVGSGQVYTPGWRLKAVGCITGDWWCYI